MPRLSRIQLITGEGDDKRFATASATTLSLRKITLFPSNLDPHRLNANLTAHASSGPCDEDSFHSTPSHLASSSSTGISRASRIVNVWPTLRSTVASSAPMPCGDASVMMAKSGGRSSMGSVLSANTSISLKKVINQRLGSSSRLTDTKPRVFSAFIFFGPFGVGDHSIRYADCPACSW